MARTVDEANRDITGVRRMPHGRARSAAALAEVDQIEAEGPANAKAYALNTLVESYYFSDEQEKAFVPFSQVVAWYDVHPEWFDAMDKEALFWSFKWMVSGLRSFPRVPLAQLQATLADMERRYAVEGYSMDAPCQQRWALARHIGDPDTDALFDEWQRQTCDDMSDCTLCARSDRIVHLFEAGRYDEALTLMESTLTDPTVRDECFSEPATLFSHAQFAYLRRGQPGDAAKAVSTHHRCRAYLGGTAAFGQTAADEARVSERAHTLAEARGRCVEFLAVTRNPQAAVRTLEDNRHFLVGAETPLSRLDFLTHVGAGLHVLVDEFGLGATPVSLVSPPIATLGELWPWVRREAEILAGEFDRRNGTSHQSELLDQAWAVTADDTRLDMRVALPEVPEPEPAPVGVDVTTAPELAVPATEQLVKDANAAVIARQPETAIRTYLRAATAFEREARLGDAGFARAEAGRLSLLLDDLETADKCLARAVQLLKAATTPPEFAAPVSVVWAECLSRNGDAAQATKVLDQVASTLDATLAEPAAEGVTEDVRRRRTSDLTWARTRVDEVHADIMLRAGDPDGAALAEQAAESYARLGMIAPAAAAFMTAGQGWMGVDDDKAVWCLQSAVEGYKLALRGADKTRAANQLIILLQRLGRTQEAANVRTEL